MRVQLRTVRRRENFKVLIGFSSKSQDLCESFSEERSADVGGSVVILSELTDVFLG